MISGNVTVPQYSWIFRTFEETASYLIGKTVGSRPFLQGFGVDNFSINNWKFLFNDGRVVRRRRRRIDDQENSARKRGPSKGSNEKLEPKTAREKKNHVKRGLRTPLREQDLGSWV